MDEGHMSQHFAFVWSIQNSPFPCFSVTPPTTYGLLVRTIRVFKFTQYLSHNLSVLFKNVHGDSCHHMHGCFSSLADAITTGMVDNCLC